MSMSSTDLAAISLMSAPAANARSEPVTTIAPMPGSASKAVPPPRPRASTCGVQRVERLGAVQCDPADAASRLDQDRLVLGHALSSRACALSAADRVDDPEKSCPAPAPVRERPGRSPRRPPSRASTPVELDRLVGEAEVLRHQRSGEARLVVAVGGARGDGARNRAVGRQRPALAGRVGCDVEQRLMRRPSARRGRMPRRRRSATPRGSCCCTPSPPARAGPATVHDAPAHRLQDGPSPAKSSTSPPTMKVSVPARPRRRRPRRVRQPRCPAAAAAARARPGRRRPRWSTSR